MRKYLISVSFAAMLAACSTQQQQTIVTVGCAVSAITPGALVVADDVAAITDPSAVSTIQMIQAKDQAVHPLVQNACAAKLAGSAPVDGTVNAVSVPVAPAVNQTNIVTLSVAK